MCQENSCEWYDKMKFLFGCLFYYSCSGSRGSFYGLGLLWGLGEGGMCVCFVIVGLYGEYLNF